jgi:DNA polymerase III subunit alpha
MLARSQNIDFPHLRVQSCFSFLRGLASPRALVEAAVQHGCSALALTDRHSLTGAIEFYDACREAGVKPILGLEVFAGPPADLSTLSPSVLALLALDLEGWANLCRLASTVNSADEVLPFERLAEHSAGLICLSGGIRGGVSSLLALGQPPAAKALLEKQAGIFPGCYYVELQRHTPADYPLAVELSALAGKLSLPLAASQDIHFLHPEQSDLQKLVSAIRCNRVVHELTQEEVAPEGAHFLSPGELVERFTDLPQALQGSREIALRCQLELPLGKAHFPEFDLPPGKTAVDVLAEKARLGARRIYAPGPGESLPETVTARLDQELKVIAETGYAALFLIVEDILSFARRQGILFASRGSAASSLVAHCLGITTPDPVSLNLYFERFLNPARHSPPDIDTDLDSNRRDEVIHYVYKRFGEDRVATVGTINRLRRRSALRAAAKAFGFPADEISRMVSALPYRWVSPARRGREDDDPFEPLRSRFPNRRHQELFIAARALIGLPSHLSVHPGGMVIAPGAITDLVPLQLAAKGVAITQFDLESIERLGLVKIDLLGIRGLTVLAQVAEAIAPPGLSRDPESVLGRIPDEDPATSDLLERGRTIGCFQIESPWHASDPATNPRPQRSRCAARPGFVPSRTFDRRLKRCLRQAPSPPGDPRIPASCAGKSAGGYLRRDPVSRTGPAHRPRPGWFEPGRCGPAAPGDVAFRSW